MTVQDRAYPPENGPLAGKSGVGGTSGYHGGGGHFQSALSDVPLDAPDDASPAQPAITDRGPPRWYALVVRPQAEAKAEAWLRLRNVYAFHPVTHRIKPIRGEAVRIEVRYLPGYVFARFKGRMIWHRVKDCRFIANVIRMSSGEPATLDPADLKRIHDMRHVDDANHARRRAAMIVRAGDSARILSGYGEGQVVEVTEIRAGNAVLTLKLFGSEREAIVPVARLMREG